MKNSDQEYNNLRGSIYLAKDSSLSIITEDIEPEIISSIISPNCPPNSPIITENSSKRKLSFSGYLNSFSKILSENQKDNSEQDLLILLERFIIYCKGLNSYLINYKNSLRDDIFSSVRKEEYELLKFYLWIHQIITDLNNEIIPNLPDLIKNIYMIQNSDNLQNKFEKVLEENKLRPFKAEKQELKEKFVELQNKSIKLDQRSRITNSEPAYFNSSLSPSAPRIVTNKGRNIRYLDMEKS